MFAANEHGPSRFLQALADRPLLLDAAMGTRLIERGLNLADNDPAFWNLSHPQIISEVHNLDVAAGSDVLVTNTFGANAGWLARFGRQKEVTAINERAVDLARAAAGPDRFLLGSIGPMAREAPGAYRDQAKALIVAGVDALLLETHRVDQALTGLQELRGIGAPIAVSLYRWDDSLAELLHLGEAGPDIFGWNCLSLVSCRQLARLSQGTMTESMIVQPNSGSEEDGFESPQSFARSVPELLEMGVRLIGGCCGTTEAHIASMRLALDLAASNRVS